MTLRGEFAAGNIGIMCWSSGFIPTTWRDSLVFPAAPLASASLSLIPCQVQPSRGGPTVPSVGGGGAPRPLVRGWRGGYHIFFLVPFFPFFSPGIHPSIVSLPGVPCPLGRGKGRDYSGMDA
jgi:hypothetical protein